MIFPDDEDGHVLKSLFDQGVDLEQPRLIEFYCYCKQHQANEIVNRFEECGLSSDIFVDNENKEHAATYSIYGSKIMIPEYEKIIQMQIQLNDVLKEFDTRCDGWGTMSTPSEHRAS